MKALALASALLLAVVTPVAASDQSPLDLVLREARQASLPPVFKLPRKGRLRLRLPAPRRVGNAWPAVASAAAKYGLPASLARAVCMQESGCRFGLRGAAGELGPMQIKPATARFLGYGGPVGALAGATGAYWGTLHLAKAYRRCGTASGAAKLHNAGLGASCRANAYARKVVGRM